MQYPATMQSTLARIEQISPDEEEAAEGNAKFPPVPYKTARNFLVTDTYLYSPVGLAPVAAQDKSDPADFLASFNGLGAVSNDIKDLLPPECRTAFDEAVDRGREWKQQWGTEGEKAARRMPIIDKAIVPYSMAS